MPALNIPVIALAGTIGEEAAIVREHGIDAFFSTVPAPETLEEAMAGAENEIIQCAENVMRTVLAGMAMAGKRDAAN